MAKRLLDHEFYSVDVEETNMSLEERALYFYQEFFSREGNVHFIARSIVYSFRCFLWEQASWESVTIPYYHEGLWGNDVKGSWRKGYVICLFYKIVINDKRNIITIWKNMHILFSTAITFSTIQRVCMIIVIDISSPIQTNHSTQKIINESSRIFPTDSWSQI